MLTEIRTLCIYIPASFNGSPLTERGVGERGVGERGVGERGVGERGMVIRREFNLPEYRLEYLDVDDGEDLDDSLRDDVIILFNTFIFSNSMLGFLTTIMSHCRKNGIRSM